MGYLSLKERFKIPEYDNPEHIKTGDLEFNKERCNQCGVCVSICPGGCILSEKFTKMDYFTGKAGGKGGFTRLDRLKSGMTLCIACFCCGTACPKDAISIKRNFNPVYYYKRLTQTHDMEYPKKY